MSDAIVLAGGGSKGAFQVGALERLYEVGVRPDILVGVSVGSLNALKLAEDPHTPDQLSKLRAMWEGLRSNDDMFSRQPWLERLEPALIDAVENATQLYSPFSMFPLLGIINFMALGLSLNEIGKTAKAFQHGTTEPSIYNLGPLVSLIRNNVNEVAVRSAPIQLLLAVTNYTVSERRYVNKHGQLLDRRLRSVGPSVSLIDAALASGSIPVVFVPTTLAGEQYVDGAIRAPLPIRAAVQLGASRVFAILLNPFPVMRASGTTIPEIALRTIDLMMDEMLAEEISGAAPVEVIVIAPLSDLHSPLLVDPAVVRIDMDYGYMRTADVLSTATAQVRALTQQIVGIRYEIARLEESACGSYPNFGAALQVRQKKRELVTLVVQRLSLGGALPVQFERWWRNWEMHAFTPAFPTPWHAYSFVGGANLAAESPPDPRFTEPGVGGIEGDLDYMRIADLLPGVDPRVANLTQQITELRREIARLEESACGSNPNFGAALQVRQKKRELMTLVVQRLSLGGALPVQYERWWRNWEMHAFTPAFPTPWHAYSFVGGANLAAESPPDPAPTNAAIFVSQDGVPAHMLLYSWYPVVLALRNSGTSTWRSTGNNPFRLVAPNSGWRPDVVDVPADIPPGATATFRFSVSAAKTGLYSFGWQMRQEGLGLFGAQTRKVSVVVWREAAPDVEAARRDTKLRAWQIWLQRGHRFGDDWKDWFDAKEELGLSEDIRI